jgi:chaperone required for assembly of F1-ATPase
MTISELLAASLLLSGCVAASSQLQVTVVAAGMAEEQRQELRERVEAELNGIESRLAQQAAALAARPVPAPSCGDWVERWLQELQLQPAEGGLQRHQEGHAGAALLQVEVNAEGLDEPRRRLYSPAAFGLCGEQGVL